MFYAHALRDGLGHTYYKRDDHYPICTKLHYGCLLALWDSAMHVATLASSPGPFSQLFIVARNKARGGPGTRCHARDAKGRFEVESI